MIDLLASDSGMEDMLWRGSEVSTVQIPEDLAGADKCGLIRAIPCIDSLFAFEKEEARSWTCESSQREA